MARACRDLPTAMAPSLTFNMVAPAAQEHRVHPRLELCL